MQDQVKTRGSGSFDHTLLANKENQSLLTDIHRGIEKEGLRVDEHGRLSIRPHPEKLGSALTNPWLTTDFSEALLEFITPVFTSIDDNLSYLKDLHSLTIKNLDGEAIWPASMPCYLPEDSLIPVAQYGTSNIARMKTIYRIGLGNRYGRAMQTVAGIHYNFSMPDAYWQISFDAAKSKNKTTIDNVQDYKSQGYLDLIRNFRRRYWLLIYLFGATPCFHESFIQGREHNMEKSGQQDLYLPHATSLRMGDLGYQSIAQQSLFICYNELDTYIDTLGEAIHVPYKIYEDIGVLVNGEYQQLNTSLLQIENEFYSPIRPKRVTQRGETPLHALSERGIEYVEVRCMDINPFIDTGIDGQTIRFLDTFLLYCLIMESPLCDEEEFKRIALNQSRVVMQGRDPETLVYCDRKEIPIRECARSLLNDMHETASLLDQAHHSSAYTQSIQTQLDKVDNDALTPSSQILHAMSEKNLSYLDFAKQQTDSFGEQFLNRELDKKTEDELMGSAIRSLTTQQALEKENTMNFEEFLYAYYQSE